jgi:hypothetical protein
MTDQRGTISMKENKMMDENDRGTEAEPNRQERERQATGRYAPYTHGRVEPDTISRSSDGVPAPGAWVYPTAASGDPQTQWGPALVVHERAPRAGAFGGLADAYDVAVDARVINIVFPQTLDAIDPTWATRLRATNHPGKITDYVWSVLSDAGEWDAQASVPAVCTAPAPAPPRLAEQRGEDDR